MMQEYFVAVKTLQSIKSVHNGAGLQVCQMQWYFRMS